MAIVAGSSPIWLVSLKEEAFSTWTQRERRLYEDQGEDSHPQARGKKMQEKQTWWPLDPGFPAFWIMRNEISVALSHLFVRS